MFTDVKSSFVLKNADNKLKLFEFEFIRIGKGSTHMYYVMSDSFYKAYLFALATFPTREFDLYDFDIRYFHSVAFDSLTCSIDSDTYLKQGYSEMDLPNFEEK